MSQFLPEGFGQQAQPSVDLGGASAPDSTQADIALMQRVLTAAARNPNLMPENFMAYMLDWIQTQRLSIPIGQVFGFKQQTDIRGRVTSAGAITNGVGFTVSKLGTGNYQITFSSPLSVVPAIGATIDDNSSTLACKAANATVSGFQILTYDMAGVLTDSGFYFTASPFV